MCLSTRVLENFVDTDIVRKLGLPIAGRATSIGMASSEVSMQTLGRVSGILSLMDHQYPNASFHVMPKLCAEVIVSQEFLKRHASITFVINGPKESLSINTPVRFTFISNKSVQQDHTWRGQTRRKSGSKHRSMREMEETFVRSFVGRETNQRSNRM